MVRNPDWYFFTVFGTPSKTGKWGWRVEGHHLSLNFTMDKGGRSSRPRRPSSGPTRPRSRTAPKKGLRTLPEAEDLARELFKRLDDDQKKVASRTSSSPRSAGKTTEPKVGEPVGLPAAKMNDKQKALLWEADRRLRPAHGPRRGGGRAGGGQEGRPGQGLLRLERHSSRPGIVGATRESGPLRETGTASRAAMRRVALRHGGRVPEEIRRVAHRAGPPSFRMVPRNYSSAITFSWLASGTGRDSR